VRRLNRSEAYIDKDEHTQANLTLPISEEKYIYEDRQRTCDVIHTGEGRHTHTREDIEKVTQYTGRLKRKEDYNLIQIYLRVNMRPHQIKWCLLIGCEDGKSK
jgi:hypothetical protein